MKHERIRASELVSNFSAVNKPALRIQQQQQQQGCPKIQKIKEQQQRMQSCQM